MSAQTECVYFVSLLREVIEKMNIPAPRRMPGPMYKEQRRRANAGGRIPGNYFQFHRLPRNLLVDKVMQNIFYRYVIYYRALTL